MGSFIDNRADIILKVLAHEHLVNIGIRPRCQLLKNETGCKAGDKCLFPHSKVDEQPDKKAEKEQLFNKGRESDDKML